MIETHATPDHEAIMARAHQLRAEAMRELFAAFVGLFRRKPQGKPAVI